MFDVCSCLTHFPPADTYESCADVKDVRLLGESHFYMLQKCMLQVLKTTSQFRDKGRSRHSILLYGHGDGGGGPT